MMRPDTLEDRVYQMKSIGGVDNVHTFDTRYELESLIDSYRPDILVVGSDWKGKDVVGSQYVKVRFLIESELLHHKNNTRFLFIGETCTDIYEYGTCDRISPERPRTCFTTHSSGMYSWYA